MLRHRFYNKTFDAELFVFVGDFFKFSEYMRINLQYILEDSDKYNFGLHITIRHPKKDKIVYYTWVNEFTGTIADESVVAHELLHHVFAVLTKAGISHTDSSEEAYTYYFQEVYFEVITKLHELIKPKPKRKIKKIELST